jgi:hypothetical protein
MDALNVLTLGPRWTRRIFLRIASAVSVCAVASCSLFVSLDNLSDAGDAPDSSSVDANASESLATDSAITTNDAGDAAICPGFCDNFDDRTTVADGWDHVGTQGDGQASDLSISSAEFVSPPHSLHVQIATRDDGGIDYSKITKDLTLNDDGLSIDFDLKIVGSQTGFDGYVNLMAISLGGSYAGGLSWNSYQRIVADYWVNFADGGYTQPIFDLGPSDSRWHHYHYAVHYDPTNGSILLAVDGNTIMSQTGIDTFGTGAAIPNVFNFGIGYAESPSVPALDVYFDNVQVQ